MESDTEFSDGGFAGLTEEDLELLDAVGATKPRSRTLSLGTEDFSDGGFDTLTEADLTLLDSASFSRASSSKTTLESLLMPAVVKVEYEGTPKPKPKPAPWKSAEPSPYERFRAFRHGLSVTDIVGPAWCEVQFEYGLYGMRNRKIEHRPAQFKSRTGKHIVIKQAVAVENDRVQKRGTAVHLKLERELKPVTIKLETLTSVDRWGSRIVNMISSLYALIIEGRTREMPVFGVIEGCVVTGIIDEVARVSLKARRAKEREVSETSTSLDGVEACRDNDLERPATLSTSKRTRSASPQSTPERKPKQSRPSLDTSSPGSVIIVESQPTSPARTPSLDSVLNSPIKVGGKSSKCPPLPKKPKYALKLVDTKTRKTASMPPEDQTIPAQIQLMIYHRLLSTLLARKQPFDFPTFWSVAEVDPTRPFSEVFLKDIYQISGIPDGRQLYNLNDLIALFGELVTDLDAKVDKELQIIYRKQPGAKSPATLESEGASPFADGPVASAFPTTNPSGLTVAASHGDLGDAPAASSGAGLADTTSIEELNASDDVVAQQMSLLAYWNRQLTDSNTTIATSRNGSGFVSDPSASGLGTTLAAPDIEPLISTPEMEEPLDRSIIGTKEFDIKKGFLNEYLKKTMGWWQGNRQAEGVSIEHVNRCHSCEYVDQCEWRATKAEEFASSRRQHK
ncbi:hypothetical protein CYLTODRAFT_416925 [Cylindrobasidium torrendii FP15055 ss-10]|uniref:Exonuclease V n=1 Tax=Cylindrobasidium torrendii FP15055 ss-10 TaxID=1314674 RepID=A0A0D7BT03_9AGAR|nr:hypothetical protein CYLTODRAFT_416925 [Cylindrobasidium torrendii FP15055 ss-10]